MDPLSITASLLAVVTAAIQSTKSLCDTVQRFKGRDNTLNRLQGELEDLNKILGSLAKVTDTEQSMLALLEGPVERCSQVCHEFKASMEKFKGRTKATIVDWTRMEFMRGNINDFIDSIGTYKSTISVCLGVITMHANKVSQKVLQEYNEMVQDTAYNLELHLQRIDDKLTQHINQNVNATGEDVNLEDEKEVTKQCLRICEDARSHIQSLKDRHSSLLHEAPKILLEQKSIYAKMQTRQALDDSRERLTEAVGHLVDRLNSLVQNKDSDDENEKARLLADIEVSKKCLDVCSMASEVSRQKIYRIGEIVADGDSDQVVVTTLADLFDVEKAVSRDNSAQLVGSMTADSLRHLTEQRYKSRFGTRPSGFHHIDVDTATAPGASESDRRAYTVPSHIVDKEQRPDPRASQSTPSSNEMRKRSGI